MDAVGGQDFFPHLTYVAPGPDYEIYNKIL